LNANEAELDAAREWIMSQPHVYGVSWRPEGYGAHFVVNVDPNVANVAQLRQSILDRIHGAALTLTITEPPTIS
jgi:hypothetical protein